MQWKEKKEKRSRRQLQFVMNDLIKYNFTSLFIHEEYEDVAHAVSRCWLMVILFARERELTNNIYALNRQRHQMCLLDFCSLLIAHQDYLLTWIILCGTVKSQWFLSLACLVHTAMNQHKLAQLKWKRFGIRFEPEFSWWWNGNKKTYRGISFDTRTMTDKKALACSHHEKWFGSWERLHPISMVTSSRYL